MKHRTKMKTNRAKKSFHKDNQKDCQRVAAAVLCCQKGSALIGILITMVLVSTLGTAMLSMTTSSTFNQLGSTHAAKVYYLAEAGGRYGTSVILKNFADAAGNISSLHNKTYTFSPSGEFELGLTYNASTKKYTLTSTGRIADAERTITYSITDPNIINTPFDTPEDITDLFSPTEGQVKFKDSGPSEGPALNIQVDSYTSESRITLDNSDIQDLLVDEWTSSDELLSYQLQVKIGIADHLSFDEYMVGLTFRGIDDNNFYGYSIAKKAPVRNNLPQNIWDVIPAAGQLYIVLWKRDGGAYSILSYKPAEAGHGILESGDYNNWSTLILTTEEQYRTNSAGEYVDYSDTVVEPAARVKENIITGYVQGPDASDLVPYAYARDTIIWDYSKYNPVQWDTYGSCASGPCDDITDHSFATQSDFAGSTPYEIGLHAFFDTSGANKLFVDDFAMRSGTDADDGIDQY